MVSFRRHNREYLQHKLKRLQDLQTEIYRQLQLLIPDEVVHYDSFLSRVHGSPLLRMDVLERHPYTHFVRLTYQFEKMEPDAHEEFLESLGIDQAEVERIRDWARQA